MWLRSVRGEIEEEEAPTIAVLYILGHDFIFLV